MTIEKLKKLEATYLGSNNSALRELGLAFRDVLSMSKMDAEPACSDNMFLDKHARLYFEQCQRSFRMTGEEKYRLRAKAAADLMVKPLSLDETIRLISVVRARDFASVVEAIKESPLYERVDPRTLLAALESAHLGVV